MQQRRALPEEGSGYPLRELSEDRFGIDSRSGLRCSGLELSDLRADPIRGSERGVQRLAGELLPALLRLGDLAIHPGLDLLGRLAEDRAQRSDDHSGSDEPAT